MQFFGEYDYQSSSDGDKPTVHPMSRGTLEPSQWSNSSDTASPSWVWGLNSTYPPYLSEGPSFSSTNMAQPTYPTFPHNSNNAESAPAGPVGLGGFYFGGDCGSNLGLVSPSNENSPEPGGIDRTQSSQPVTSLQNSDSNKRKRRPDTASRLYKNAREQYIMKSGTSKYNNK